MFSRKFTGAMVGVLATAGLFVLPGCDWLQGSESDQRQSPFLSVLVVSPSSVLCGGAFEISFRYDDPQGDIAVVRVTRQRLGDEESTPSEESPSWPVDQSRHSGTVTFTDFSFSCDAAIKGGIWSISVQAEDDRGHESNILTGQIRLNAPG